VVSSGPQAVSERRALQKLYQTQEELKTHPYMSASRTAFVGRPSTECRRISPFNNFLSFEHYLRIYIKLLYTKNVVMVTLTTV
jgi:hypothetical protein